MGQGSGPGHACPDPPSAPGERGRMDAAGVMPAIDSGTSGGGLPDEGPGARCGDPGTDPGHRTGRGVRHSPPQPSAPARRPPSRAVSGPQTALAPPSTGRMAPVTCRDSSEAR